MARVRAAVLIGVCLCPALELAQSPPPSTGTATAVVAELDGIIHPIASEYINEAISQADATGADVVVIVLRTPGGLLDSTRDIVSRLIASRGTRRCGTSGSLGSDDVGQVVERWRSYEA
jgi:membrane-bound serine protease (ClpP class)